VLVGEEIPFHEFMATSRYIFYIIVFMLVFSLAHFTVIYGVSHTRIFTWYMLGTVLLALIFLLDFYWVGDVAGESWSKEPPLGRNIRLVSMGVAVSVSIAVNILLSNSGSRFYQFGVWCCLVICAAFLFWTGSRASMLLALITLCILIVLMGIYKRFDYKKIALIIAGLILSAFIAEHYAVFSWSGLDRAINTFVEEVPSAENHVLANDFTSGRTMIWHETIDAIKRSPWFGYGPNASLFVLDLEHKFDQPHNFILQFFLAWGVLGGGLLLIILMYFAWYGLTKIPNAVKQNDTDYLISASVIFILTMNGLTDGTYYHIQPILCLAIAFSAFPFFNKEQKAYFAKQWR
jgi:O-antigen ligase